MRTNRCFRQLSAVLVAVCGTLAPALAQDFESRAPRAILMDHKSGTVLYEKAADEPFAPASMTKLLTAEIVFSELAAGRITFADGMKVSEHAWRDGGAPAGGSTMFAEIHSVIRVGDLLRGLIIQSGNDSAIALAEGLAGSEPAFVERMNRRAAELGMSRSRFRNPNGWPDPEQHVTARDLAILARHMIATYPVYYPIFSEPDFKWNGIFQKNRNKLLGVGGVDGMKTGYVKASGYGIVASARQEDERLIAVVAGLESSAERDREAARLLEWGFGAFRRMTLFEAGAVIGEASVYGGVPGHVPLKADGTVELLVPRQGFELKARIVYDGPLKAPLESGAPAGNLMVYDGDRLLRSAPLHAAEGAQMGPMHTRALDALTELLFGWL